MKEEKRLAEEAVSDLNERLEEAERKLKAANDGLVEGIILGGLLGFGTLGLGLAGMAGYNAIVYGAGSLAI